MKKKKICMIVQDKLVKGGIASVISSYYESELEDIYDMTFVESYKDGGKFQKLFKGIEGYCSFIKVLLVNRPELVHIHSSFGPSFYRKLPFIYLSRLFRVPIINHIHGADFDSFYCKASKLKKRLVKKIYCKCDYLIALSQEWKDRLSKIVPEEKVVIIENYSVLHDKAFNYRLARTCTNNVLFLGELGKRKGCYDIPAIVKHVCRSIPDAMFYLCGEGTNEDEKAIKKLCVDAGVIDHVVFPGWVRGTDKDAMLQKADVFFLPSYNEGMPMSILDSMGYGLPVVSTNVGGIPKIVQNNINGYCCTPGDVESLAHAIITILKDSDVQKSMSINSYEIIRKKYSLENHLKLLEALYDRV